MAYGGPIAVCQFQAERELPLRGLRTGYLVGVEDALCTMHYAFSSLVPSIAKCCASG